jgi:hypothetical protein
VLVAVRKTWEDGRSIEVNDTFSTAPKGSCFTIRADKYEAPIINDHGFML